MTGATGVIDVAEVERLAGWAAGLGPSWLRTDMRGEARLRVIEAMNAGCTSGLGLVAYRGAMGAFKAATFQAGLRQSRVASDSATGCMSLGVLLGDGERGAFGMWDGSAASADPVILGPVLDRLLDDLVERGVDRDGIGEALGLLLDKAEYSRGPRTSERVRKTHSTTGRRSRVFDVPARLMAERSGLSVQACRALKVLILGERPRAERGKPGVPGLLARAAVGEDVWADPRVEGLLTYIALPVGVLRTPWAERPPTPATPAAS